MNTATSLIQTLLILVGNTLTLAGCVGLMLGLTGVFDMDYFATGSSAGLRVVGTVAIAGCLLSAIGYGTVEYLEK